MFTVGLKIVRTKPQETHIYTINTTTACCNASCMQFNMQSMWICVVVPVERWWNYMQSVEHVTKLHTNSQIFTCTYCWNDARASTELRRVLTQHTRRARLNKLGRLIESLWKCVLFWLSYIRLGTFVERVYLNGFNDMVIDTGAAKPWPKISVASASAHTIPWMTNAIKWYFIFRLIRSFEFIIKITLGFSCIIFYNLIFQLTHFIHAYTRWVIKCNNTRRCITNDLG